MGSKSADELVIEQGIKKRRDLKEMYLAERSNVNPLVLIQLPDKGEGVDDKKDEVMRILAKEFNITEENGRLAVWLSEDKSDTLPNIEEKATTRWKSSYSNRRSLLAGIVPELPFW